MKRNQTIYTFDDKDVIEILYINPKLILRHSRKINGESFIINQYCLGERFDRGNLNNCYNKKFHLFKIKCEKDNPNFLYNYEQGKLIVPPNIWDEFYFGFEDEEDYFLEEYNGILASFNIQNSHKLLVYYNPIIKRYMDSDVFRTSEKYYAMINLDGTIRGNQLFKGNSISEVKEIIDLSNYASLEIFKQQRYLCCEQMSQSKIQHYNKMIAERNDGSNSPYLDSEVLRILKMEK